MELPDATKSDIEDGVPISIVGKVVHHNAFDDGNEMYYLKDVAGNEVELKVWASEAHKYAANTGYWYLFTDAEGDVYDGERTLGSNGGQMTVTELGDSPPDIAVQTTDDSTGRSADGGSVLALDIETVSTVPESELDLDDSDHVELLCIGVGSAPEPGVPGTTAVLFREGADSTAERELIERLCTLVETRDPAHVVTFRGAFDRTHLVGRAQRVGGTDLADRVRRIFDGRHHDLTPTGSLEDNAPVPETYWDVYAHSLDPVEWRTDHPRWNGDPRNPVVTNTDVPQFGDRYLQLREEGRNDREYRAIRELLRHYAAADIEPLFDLYAERIEQ